jgi:hypothetical protein
VDAGVTVAVRTIVVPKAGALFNDIRTVVVAVSPPTVRLKVAEAVAPLLSVTVTV